MKADQERVRNLLTDTVTLLCKNGLQYQTELRVQGVLGITLDNNDVFIVHINEKFGGDIGGAISIRNDEGDAAKTLLGGVRVGTKQSRGKSEMPIAVSPKTAEIVHRHRRRSRESLTSPALPTNSSQQHTLQRPIKRLLPSSSSIEDSSSGAKHTSFLNSTGNHPTESVCEDILDVKVKIEEEEVLIIEASEDSKAEIVGSSQNISHSTDQSAMLDSYPNLSLSEIQGSYQPFGEGLGVSNSSTNSCVDGTAPPPIKRRATSGSTQDSFGGSSEMGPGGGGPFITGIIQNETISGDLAPHTTSAAPWDQSQMPDFVSLTAQDSQMILDSTPGCSTWDTAIQSQVPAVRTPTMHSVLNTADQSSESVSTEGTGSRGQTGHSDNGHKCADFTFTSANGSSRVVDLNNYIHEGGRFICAEVDCQCSYVDKGGLKRHMNRMHNKLYRYRCETCERGFMDRSRYNDHVAAHTGDKRHTCSICEMKFTYKTSLRTHVLHIHPNEDAHIL